MVRNPDEHRLSEAEHQAIFERYIKPNLFASAKPSSQPVAVIFGGQPGAGKSAAVDEAMNELASRGGAVQIIGDDLRDYHQKYARLMRADDKTAAFYTDRDTGRWVEKAIAEAKAMRVNIVIEGTMRDSEKVAATMNSLRETGYQIDARALAVTSRLSEQGIMQRYEKQKADRGAGRMTTPEAHQAAYDGMLQTLERIESQKLADRVTIYRRGAEVIYSNELQGGQWAREPQARAVVEAERARPMTLQERRDYAKGFDELADMLGRRQASAEEVRKVADLQREAKAAVAVLPRISEFRIGYAEKTANAYEDAVQKLWASGNLPNVRKEIEERTRQTGLSVEDVMDKMKPNDEMSDLYEKFRSAVAESPEAKIHKKAMDKALDSRVRQYGRGQEELLNPETEGTPHFDALRDRLDNSHERMQKNTANTPLFEGEDKSHTQKRHESTQWIMEKLKDLVNMERGNKGADAQVDNDPSP